ncbi:hypothetical protein OPKNFCMD_6735 [Methylobacterium crusticola]|uniref:DUF4148 domain-containing protein n=1 Tax=Methylobacterium crusticola TaxID=1697972 RepID=A0ABQ4R896_9HYPH|nr:hypothetical protein [Methylobacterium crusticola]GJD53955.1 hypothetical protein OPKNFCMD_6735 [Methylobacterium crusticola]
MSLRFAAILSAAALGLPLATALPAQAEYVRCQGYEPLSCERVVTPREARMVYAENHWQPWVVAQRPYTRFDIEALRLMTRMP